MTTLDFDLCGTRSVAVLTRLLQRNWQNQNLWTDLVFTVKEEEESLQIGGCPGAREGCTGPLHYKHIMLQTPSFQPLTLQWVENMMQLFFVILFSSYRSLFMLNLTGQTKGLEAVL